MKNGEVKDGPGEETSRVNNGWSEVGQGGFDDEDGDLDAADLAVARDGRDRGERKSFDRIFIVRLLLCIPAIKGK